MTNTEKWSGLEERVLVFVAEQCESALDTVKVGSRVMVKVHDVLTAFRGSEDATPTAVRVALLNLIDRELLDGMDRGRDLDLLSDSATVTVRVRGLAKARELWASGVRSQRLRLKSKIGHGPFECEFETGNKDLDQSLNQKGSVLACFYLVAAIEPTKEKPLIVSQCAPMLKRLVAHGVRRRSGPKAADGRLSDQAIRGALQDLRPIVSVRQTWREDDSRHDEWYLEAGFPDVLLVPALPDHYQSWDRLRSALFRIVRGEDYMKPSGEFERAAAKEGEGRIASKKSKPGPGVEGTTEQ
jgi:hypothetical protein